MLTIFAVSCIPQTKPASTQTSAHASVWLYPQKQSSRVLCCLLAAAPSLVAIENACSLLSNCYAHTPSNRAVLGAEDIADPKHPLRFHQFITNMKRSTSSPIPANPQDSPEPGSSQEADPHAALSSQAAQPSQASAGHTPTDQTPTGQSSSGTTQGTGARAGSEAGSGQYQSLYTDLAGLVPPDEMSRTLSRGGPVPGSQVGTNPATMHQSDARLSGSLL